jgi:hypothetical protein
VDVQVDFWNGEPDIDAVCRMEHAPECDFDPDVFPIASNRPSPFDSQNTFFTGAMIKDYFLYPHVGPMDDIWASYYVQAKGYESNHLVGSNPTPPPLPLVFQWVNIGIMV